MTTGRLAIDPKSDLYRVKLPPALAVGGAKYSALLQVSVSELGEVVGVTLLQSAHPALDGEIVHTLARWRYHPHLVDGRAVRFRTEVRYEIESR